VLMPAIMRVLGAKAWWIPRWLDRILPHVDIDGHDVEGHDEASRVVADDAEPMAFETSPV